MNRIASAAAKNTIPLLFCLFLLLSLIRIRLGGLPSAPDAERTPEYIDGFVYDAIWNKNGQLLFLPEAGDALLLSCTALPPERIETLGRGTYLRVTLSEGTITVPDTASNPGAFDQRQYLAGRGVKGIVMPAAGALTCLPKTELSLWFRLRTFYLRAAAALRRNMNDTLQTALGEQYAGTAIAVLTGDTAGITEEEMQGYRDSGIAHVMAVSGMHAGFVQNLTMRLVSRKKIGYPARQLFCAAVLLLFGCIADFSPSVTRAVLQNGYVLIAKALKKPCKAQNALCAACALQLAENPYVLFNTGFLLSYTAAASILVIKPALAKQFFFFRKIPDCIGVGLAVNLGMLPLLVTFFNCFSPVGILATIFAAKLAYWICMLGFTIWIAGAAVPFLMIVVKIPAFLISSALHALHQVSAVGAGLPPPVGPVQLPSIPAGWILLYYVFLFLFLNRTCFLFVKKHAILSAFCVLLILTTYVLRKNRTEILFFDVGQGFSALIRTGNVCGLIDGGDGKTDVSSLLFRQGVGTLDFILLTHGHADHTEGLYDVLKEHRVKCLFVPDNPYDAGVYAVSQAAAAQNIEVIRIRGTQEYLLGDLRINLYANEAFMISEEESDVNNSSLVLRAVSRDGSVLFPGDIEREAESLLVRSEGFGKTDVLAVAHHGSDTGSEAKNISIISPDYAIISVGRKNRYGHPSERVTKTLEDAGAEVYRSDLCGAVRITIRKGTLHLWQKLKTSDQSELI